MKNIHAKPSTTK